MSSEKRGVENSSEIPWRYTLQAPCFASEKFCSDPLIFF